MAMVDANDVRRGMIVELDGVVFDIVSYHHHKPGKGPATIRLRLRNIKLDTVIERSFDSFFKMKEADVEKNDIQYLYKDGEDFVFMDMTSFEQMHFTPAQLGDNVLFLKENTIIYAVIYKDEPIGIELPTTVDLKVIETTSGIRGDTVSGGSKPATLETKLVVQVPLFVNVGEIIKVDTRTHEYLERV